MDRSHLLDQLTHVLCTGAGSRLIGHRRNPFHQVLLEETTDRHQHQTYRAISSDIGLDAFADPVLDHVEIDRVEDDDRIVLHA